MTLSAADQPNMLLSNDQQKSPAPDVRAGFTDAADIETAENGAANWRDIFTLRLTDCRLREHVSGFLDFFQNNEFESVLPMPSGRWGKGKVRGQQVMNFIKKHHDIALAEISADSQARIEIEKHGLMADGKFLISQEDGIFGSGTGGQTLVGEVEFDRINYPYPVCIRLAPDEIKKSSYRTSSGARMPVSIDMVLAHELGHFIYPHTDPEMSEAGAMFVENIILSHMRVPTRGFDYSNSRMIYERVARKNYSVHYTATRAEQVETDTGQPVDKNKLNLDKR